MPNSATVYLPINTWVHVRAVTNAAFDQRVTITPETGAAVVLTGSGEHDTLLPNGDYGFTTPGSSKSPAGYRVVVTVECSNGAGWQPTHVMQGGTSIQYYNLAMVVSEDYVDQDWNDAVVMFSWWTPPSARDVRDLHKTPVVGGS